MFLVLGGFERRAYLALFLSLELHVSRVVCHGTTVTPVLNSPRRRSALAVALLAALELFPYSINMLMLSVKSRIIINSLL